MQTFQPNDVIGERYRIKHEIGSGGFGRVYKAHHLHLDHDVAVKIVNLNHSEITDAQMPGCYARFRREAQSLAQLKHTGIVRVMDFGMIGKDAPYLVMEYFAGEPLLKWGERSLPTTNQWLTVFRQIFDALDHAHTQNIVHRDIKSANVLVKGPAENSEVMLIDWGIAYSAKAPRLTKQGEIVGSSGAIDPELYSDADAAYTPQSDFYAVGGLLYSAICKQDPFSDSSSNLQTKQLSIVANSFISPSEILPDINPDLEVFILRLLATERQQRPPSAKACMAIIDTLIKNEPLDLDNIYEAYPFIETMGNNKPKSNHSTPESNTASLNTMAMNKNDQTLGAELLAEFERAKLHSDSVKPIEKIGPSESIIMPANLVNNVVDLANLPKPLSSVKANPINVEARAANFGYKNVAQENRLVRYLTPALVVVIAILATLLVVGHQRTLSQASTPEQFIVNAIKPEDLETKRDDSALSKFSPQQQPLLAGGSLSQFDPEVKARYAPMIGGSTTPPVEATLPHIGNSDGQRSKDKDDDKHQNDKFDRTMGPIATLNPNNHSTKLPIPYNTEIEIRLIDTLDTSNDEPIRAELLHSFMVNGDIIIPFGTIFSGHAALKNNRAHAHFDTATFPNGEEHKLSAIAVMQDGREGIEGGRFEYGDDPPNKTGEKVLRAVGSIASDAIASLPGGDVLTRGAQNIASDTTRDATELDKSTTRTKNRVTIQRKTFLKIRVKAT